MFYGQKCPSEKTTSSECGVGQLSTTCSNVTEVVHGELPVAVDLNQIRTMASKTGDPIDWVLLPSLHRAVPSELHVLHSVNAGYKSQDLLQQLGREHASLGMPGQRTACAATQGIKEPNFLV